MKSGGELEAAVRKVRRSLGLQIRRQVKVGRRLWGAERHIDVVLTLPDSGRSLGLECKYQGVGGHLTSFDRRTCRVLNGPTATGAHCPEGWRLYWKPCPTFAGMTVNADLNYLIYVDRHSTLGVGRNVAMTQAVNSDSVIAVIHETGEWVTLQVPYPMEFHARPVHGRIDDPDTGWKGRGLWSSDMIYTAWHLEGG